MTYIGIDVSKDMLDIAWPENDAWRHQQVPNNNAGFGQLILPDDAHVIVEATGPYYMPLACFLTDTGIPLSVINPLVSKHFARMRLKRAKTDKVDACLLSEYGRVEQPDVWQMPERYVLELKQLQATRDHYVGERTRIKNQYHAFTAGGRPSKIVLGSLKRLLGHVEREIKRLDEAMEQLITTHHGALYKRLQTIPGIGPKTALLLIVISDGFRRFSEVKSLVSYAGLAPRIYASGRRQRGHTPLAKLGMKRLRCDLYMGACSAIRYNASCKALYERLVARGKPRLVALLAVAHKLLRQAFAVAKSGGVYDEKLSGVGGG